MLQKKLSLLLHLQHKSLYLSIFSIPFVLNYGLLPGVSLTLSSYHGFQEDMILKLDNSAQIFNLLSDIPGEITDADDLLEVCTCT